MTGTPGNECKRSMISVNIVVSAVVLVSSGITLRCIGLFSRVILHLLDKI